MCTISFKRRQIGAFVILVGLNLPVYATSPWLAIVDKDDVSMTLENCLQTSQAVLLKQEYARVNISGRTLIAAYRKGKNYLFKTVVKCRPNAKNLTVTVISTRPKIAKAVANKAIDEIVNRLKALAVPAAPPATPPASSAPIK